MITAEVPGGTVSAAVNQRPKNTAVLGTPIRRATSRSVPDSRTRGGTNEKNRPRASAAEPARNAASQIGAASVSPTWTNR